jgi:hypothetical protein
MGQRMLQTLPGSKAQMHRRGSESHGSLRNRLRARYRAHPTAARYQFGFLIGAVVLLVASCVSLALA